MYIIHVQTCIRIACANMTLITKHHL